jgi:hypothetical protein
VDEEAHHQIPDPSSVFKLLSRAEADEEACHWIPDPPPVSELVFSHWFSPSLLVLALLPV